MLYLRRKILFVLLKLSDVCICFSGLLVTSWLVTHEMQVMTLTEFLSMRIRIVNFFYLIAMLLIWHLAFEGFNLYRSRRLETKLQDKIREWRVILGATSAATTIFFICGIIFAIDTLTLNFCLLFWTSTTLLTIAFRTFLRYFLQRVRIHGRNLRFILIVGTNKRAYEFEKLIDENKELGYRIRGFIDDLVYHPRENIDLLGTLDDFRGVIRKDIVDEILIALPVKSYYEKIQKVIEQAEEQGILVRYLSQLFISKSSTAELSLLEGFPLLATVNGSQDNWQFLVKRALDICLALVLLILFFPLFLLASAAIKLTSPGPVFFVQNRVGYNKRIFSLYKFRTMVTNAESLQTTLESENEMEGPVFKIKDDPRITRVGKWLRKTSLDEVPQLVNVLKGDMSLVGPRPLPVRDYEGFSKDWQRRRFSVRPGITCFWQVMGRNDIPFEKWMELDMEYIDQWSLMLDLKIIVKTIPAVFRRTGAV